MGEQKELWENETQVLSRMRSNWRATIENDGGYCPCCDKWGKISPFPMTEIMALGLLWMSRAPTDEWGWVSTPLHAPRWMLRGKSFTTMHRWGLIEQAQRSEDPARKRDGLWRVTDKGRNFIAGEFTIPKKVYIYNNQVEGFSEEHVSFKDCFGKHFDYGAVMSENFNMAQLVVVEHGHE